MVGLIAVVVAYGGDAGQEGMKSWVHVDSVGKQRSQAGDRPQTPQESKKDIEVSGYKRQIDEQYVRLSQ